MSASVTHRSAAPYRSEIKEIFDGSAAMNWKAREPCLLCRCWDQREERSAFCSPCDDFNPNNPSHYL